MEKTSERIVFHIDMDAFFAAIEERDHPEFHRFPVVVGADPQEGRGRGVVSTANYEARKYGVHSAQPIGKAWELCKQGVALRQTQGKEARPCIFFQGSFLKYAVESRKVMGIVQKYAAPHLRGESRSAERGEKFEQVGVDEAYLELENRDQKSDLRYAEKIAKKIKAEVKKETRLMCSIGIGPNKLIAKIASDFKKPDGLTVVPSAKVQDFLDPMPTRAIPGIGPKTDGILETYGIRTIKELREISPEKLENWFGKWGIGMWESAHGQDDRPVGEFHETKSIGREYTFEEDTLDAGELLGVLKDLAQRVAKDITDEGVSFKTMELKVRFSGFVTKTRAKTLVDASKNKMSIERTATALFLPFLDHRENPQHKKIRLLGIRVSRLIEL